MTLFLLILGFGFGLIYLPAIVCVSVYFEKYRSLATGIAVCGSGAGTAAIDALLKFLVENYQWRATLRILALLVVLCILFGLLFREIEVVQDPTEIPMLVNILFIILKKINIIYIYILINNLITGNFSNQ